jgi:hypothetical protein
MLKTAETAASSIRKAVDDASHAVCNQPPDV